VDEVHVHLASRGFLGTKPRDAPWGERFFRVRDPDGHEVSVAMLLKSKPPWFDVNDGGTSIQASCSIV